MTQLPKHMPQLISVMTPFPYSIKAEASLANAKSMMAEHNIHHLPVMDKDGNLEGIICTRDLQKAITIGHSEEADLKQSELLIRDICSQAAVCADVSDPLDKVLSVMLKQQLNAVLAIKEGELAGIFTESDACKVLHNMLQQLYIPEPELSA